MENVLYTRIKQLVEYGIRTGLTDERERVYTTNLLLDALREPEYEDPGPVEEAAQVMWPLKGETVSAFSVDELQYSETLGDWRTHDGIDIAAAEGTQVTAAAAGEVTSVVDDYWMGTTVTVDCGDGRELRYASLQSPAAVSTGDAVSPGDVIGAVGSTALLEEAVGPHLHFTVLQSGVAVDPAAYLARNGAA